MTDFASTYAQVQPTIVAITTNTGTGLAEASGFVTIVSGNKYIMTAAHAVLLESGVWGMDTVLINDDGSRGCGLYRNSGTLELPAGISAVIFRFVARNPQRGVFLDNVIVERVFADNFNRGNSFKPEWSAGAGVPWTLVRRKGKAFGTAARSGDLSSSNDFLSTLVLNIETTTATTLKFDYKLDCDAGSFIVGYCTGSNCDNRVARNITAYYGGQIHPLRVVGIDGKGDIALCLPADGSSLAALPALTLIPDSRTVPIGTPVAAIGNPLGIDPQSIATGVIRDNKYTLPVPQNVESIFTCLSGYAGNSGSPYVLANGQVVGMLTFGLGTDSTLNGGPSSRLLTRVATNLAARIGTEGVVEYQKAYLGLNLYAIDLSVVDQLTLPMKGAGALAIPSGFVVLSSEADSPLEGVVKQLDVLLTLEETGNPASKVVLGTFPNQSGPSEVTWFMNANSKVNFELLRFDQQAGAWKRMTLSGVMLRPFPVSKDVPLGSTFSFRQQSTSKAAIKITRRDKDGSSADTYYSMNSAL